MSSTITLANPAGGTNAPTSQVFTMVVDTEQRSAIVSPGGSGSEVPVELFDAGFRLAGFDVVSDTCNTRSVRYEGVTFTVGVGGRLSGTSHGRVRWLVSGDVASAADADMALTGVADAQGPTFTAWGNGGDIADPFTAFALMASEALPRDARVVLVADTGEGVPFAVGNAAAAPFASFFSQTALLRYGVRYRLNLDGVTDFAGNAAGSPTLELTTRAAPPLVAEDGFESVTGPTLDGAQILVGPGAPVITGTRSLYMPPAPSPTAQATQFALRLAVAAGDTVIRFHYRVVEPPSRPDSTPFAVGSPGASRLVMMLPRATAPNELVTFPEKGSAWVGPLATAEIPLPPDATSEVVIARIQRGYGCPGAPFPPVEGIIIDDLRVE